MSSYEQSEQINELAMALSRAQSAMQAAPKDSKNSFFNSRYSDLATVWDTCREALTSNGLSVVQMPIDTQEGYAGLRSILMHSSGQYMACTMSVQLPRPGESDDGDRKAKKIQHAQALGSALTYMRRYSLSALVGIASDEDDDGNAASGRYQQPAQQARQAPPQPRQNGHAPEHGAGYSHTREQLLGALRAAYSEAKKAGADVSPPGRDEVAGWSDEMVRQAMEVFRAATLEASRKRDAELDEIDRAVEGMPK